ncbi:MAG: fused MFS/spermidine synthase [Magnetovibrio sp.]|nr:fused MFS/spermidine synthase [Magnetovibrio sp.]
MSTAAAIQRSPSRFLTATFMLTLVTSAGLLFWLQPMIAKFILPRVGGAPAVWNTAMMFFQAALLAGYLYAHLLNRHFSTRTQVFTHIALLMVCLAWLPIGIDPTSVPPGQGNPSWWVLRVLALGVGIPFVVISGSAPLLQCWFAVSGHRDADNPYFLYAASNIGSMGALFCFPLVAEPLLDLPGQSLAWSLTFGALVILSAISGGLALSHAQPQPLRHNTPPDGIIAPHAGAAPTNMQRFMWLALVMASTSVMLGITTHITTDVAAVPLLWVVPLALYLLTFIIVFARHPLVTSNSALKLLLIGLVLFGGVWLWRDPSGQWLIWVLALLAVFFITVLSCHAELAQLKPHKAWLTEFYLWMAVGGVLGGMFNALAAPLLFQGATEFALMMGVAVALILAARSVGRDESPTPMLVLALTCIVAPLAAERAGLLLPDSVLERQRNFFGVVSVVEDQSLNVRALQYGTTAHGMRDLRPGQDLEPVGYYGRKSPLGDVMAELIERPKTGNIAAIGLGVGSISCYPMGGRSLTFYEINPAVTQLAEHPDYFGFLKGCGANYRVIHGDGRLKIQAAPPASFDLIFLDAFTSDSIPVHLLTFEAIALYMDKLAPGGMVLVHISNNHLDLAPVLAAIAGDLGLVAYERIRRVDGSNANANRLIQAQAHMVVLARKDADLGNLPSLPGWKALNTKSSARTWSDGYTNIIGTLRALKTWTD